MALYDEAAQAAAAQVIARYSTSFGMGARMLSATQRRHIESVYAMVRVADEIVDTYQGADAGELLDGFEAEVWRAMTSGYSTNLVAHAFGATASAVGITREQTDPFFASMRMDLDRAVHDEESFATYIFGSAEVVGEMCLAVFANSGSGPRPLDADMRTGARRLGAAYQKVNFLRDLGADEDRLGRSYFPGLTSSTLTDAGVAALVADCRADVAAAEACLTGLPRRSAAAVRTTIDIYARLLDEIESTPAQSLAGARVRVANGTKLYLALRNSCPWTAPRRDTLQASA
ncbi:phytoene/squalene synthase family protein [Demequina muriae]|uniref:Squalene/phytoene synthase family protein n=1 Tax=Demequina muriae TaxID=3051664 RepID=A0ABT8GGH5_9MICO|nr:squalene/phytoene synthase family protein [Demequina sp. EGI L300058]MDN4480538.1 squalene/phytoene synthase family protein [Demequina sp. EGI L300058]